MAITDGRILTDATTTGGDMLPGNWALIPATEAFRMFRSIEKSMRREASGGEPAEIVLGELVVNHITTRIDDKYCTMLARQLNENFAKVAEVVHQAVVELADKTKQERKFEQLGQLCDQVNWMRIGQLKLALDSINSMLDEATDSGVNWVKHNALVDLTDEQCLNIEHAIRATTNMVKSVLAAARRRADSLAACEDQHIVSLVVQR